MVALAIAGAATPSTPLFPTSPVGVLHARPVGAPPISNLLHLPVRGGWNPRFRPLEPPPLEPPPENGWGSPGAPDSPPPPLDIPSTPSIPSIICNPRFRWDCRHALAIVYGRRLFPGATCPNGESGGDPAAISANGRYLGLFQEDVGHYGRMGIPEDWAFDPEINTEVAYKLWEESGGSFAPWSCA